MSYQAIYRKYRPTTFEDVYGQSQITRVLKNQVKAGNAAHAYLFSGTRGTGKTSTAKILSRAVNCLHPVDGNPCNECEICKGLLEESIYDVVEMDAASNNSVEDIRELKEKVKYLPTKAAKKVYIIDEVHMLSKGAFNALLKTLEEPPSHLVFILATTEPQKLPATIISRCQRYEFHRLSVEDMAANMGEILTKMNRQASPAALRLIGRNSEGAMRDALSILDQCTAANEGIIEVEDVVSVLGSVQEEVLFELIQALWERDARRVLSVIDTMIMKGKDLRQFTRELVHVFRNLMIVKVSTDLEDLLQCTDEQIEGYRLQAEKFPQEEILRYLSGLSGLESQLAYATSPRVLLEAGLIRLMNQPDEKTWEGLLERVRRLEEEGLSISKPRSSAPVPVASVAAGSLGGTGGVQEEGQSYEQVAAKPEARAVSFTDVHQQWEDILLGVKFRSGSLYAMMDRGEPVAFTNGRLTIAYDDKNEFFRKEVAKPTNLAIIRQAIEESLGMPIHVDVKRLSEIRPHAASQGVDEGIEKAKQFFGEDLIKIK
jgi:DNA polymerase-3 subunit gamma/tau